MSTEVTTIAPDAALTTIRDGAPRLGVLFGLVDIEGWRKHRLRRALTPDDRAFLASAARACQALLVPAGRAEASAVIAGLLIAFGSKPGESEAAVLVNAYLEACQSAPLWAMNEARANFLAGRVERQSKTFAPKPPELVAEIDRILAGVRTADGRIAALRIARHTPAPAIRRIVPAAWRSMRERLAPEPIAPQSPPDAPVADKTPVQVTPSLKRLLADA